MVEVAESAVIGFVWTIKLRSLERLSRRECLEIEEELFW